MRQWRLIYDQHATGAYNMAADDAILDAVIVGNSPPTLRLYGWSLPCLSLGYGQPDTDADFQRIAERGWQIVRRPTGGRAILHTDELTYSLALPSDHPIAAGDIVESYRRISQALLAALEQLGLQPQSEKSQTPQANKSNAVCFETPSHYEITVAGRKLIGSAQVRRKGGMLQHGSLPLGGDLARICDALSYPDEAARATARSKVRSRAVTLSEAVERTIDWQTVADAVAHGFEAVFDIDFTVEDGLSAAEADHTEQLMYGRYSTLERVRVIE